ncbi:MAG: biopolymer transporter ExbD [Verrucomicrobia bacterium]|nr:biopolymer transporter ExbD [bacterium]NDA09911.1 biopolymer transporter ExbD [Verrucomicrobiota bacterium]NDA25448.1 biopolymer transporter ExbD [Verrucomicrobiota bacterium]NDD56414.1 biopolymer transporter ExbD [Verrucomicrobiota bacterium]NDD81254.1 biopolymer transporter ExbD [Verrucomicrobiota bacterium]
MAGGGGGGEGEFGLQIAPMLDVMFVLLMFFMVMAGQQVKEAELGVSVPGSGQPSTTAKAPVTIRIAPDGVVTFNDTPVDTREDREMPKLRNRLKGLIEASAEQSVIIRPNDRAPYQRVVDVLNACGAERVKNLTFGG